MNKNKEILKFWLMISLIVIVGNILCIKSYSGGDKMVTKSNLISDHNLDLRDVDRVIIKNTKYSLSLKPSRYLEITDKTEIDNIIAGLANVYKTGGIDTIVDYDVEFWKDNNILLVLGLKIYFDYHPDSSFIRYKKAACDYRLSSEFYEFLVSLLSMDKEDESGKF